jgi:dynein heavy chain
VLAGNLCCMLLLLRFCRLSGVMRSTLVELQRAIKGLVVMSSELEAMYNALLSNQVGNGLMW